ncbi:MAG: DUF1800 domain-containing protein [Blastocatellia bacterium]|nr:DUF1800 domain-containing protein [Blastocatellia bacterium]
MGRKIQWRKSAKRRALQRPGAVLLLLALLSGPLAAQSAGTRLQDGHLLRRIGFGPTPAELELLGRIGSYRYLAQQLAPETVDDSAVTARLAAMRPAAGDEMGYVFFPQRWYVRMIYSKRQLLEKMTLTWHEHFATSVAKAGMTPLMMAVQEETMRRNALGSFRQMLMAITVDPAMLIWLDNNENNGRGAKAPNENYARELLQLFTLGVNELNPDGTIRRDAQGRPMPAYAERDIKEVARALTGWYVKYDETTKLFVPAFNPDWHDGGAKTILGRRISGRLGADGAREVEEVVEILMAQPTMAPFIARMLIQKFATQTPTPRYVERVARTFAATGGDLRATMFTLLVDREFWRPETMRSQPKSPIEHLAGILRGFEAESQGRLMVEFGFATRHLVYYPPSVFSFYPPGEKEALLATDLVLMRDNAALVLLFTDPGNDSWVNLNSYFNRHKIRATPEGMIDDMSELLMQAPLEPQARARILKLINDYGEMSPDVIKIALWLLISTPDYQRN